MADLAKQDKALKSLMGDQRREITKKVGQMTAGDSNEVKAANRGRILSVKTILLQANQRSQPTFDVRTFLVPSRRIEASPAELQVSGVFIYLLNIFTKTVIKQYIGEAGISPEKAEPVGLLLANIFGQQALQWQGHTYLIDIFLAKYHRVCPVLFGIYGPSNTAAGRQRSGWLPQFTAQENSERMTGLGAGFAAITLRNFSKSAAKNPMPVSLLWRSLATIVNTPAGHATETHYLVLKALLDPVYVQKLIRFYGDVGLALLRKAVLDFPARSNSVAANAVKVLPDLYKRQIDLVLV
ncbi:MAG: hypothetical protein INR71_07400 [Terriglobus roseus]|nr:hypothetical protein [Terriglobus roseus]